MTKQSPAIAPVLFDVTLMLGEQMKQRLAGVDDQLSPVQVLILRALVDQGAMTQKGICTYLSRDKSQVAKLVTDLDQKGLVFREPLKEDKRSNVVRPAADVLKTVRKIQRDEQDLADKILQDLSQDEQAALLGLLEKMRTNLKTLPKQAR